MRKKLLILIMALAFVAASLLMPATSFAAQFPVCHNGAVLSLDPSAIQAHLNHGDFLILEGVSCP